MVTTLTLPSSALGFTLDSNNEYRIHLKVDMREICKLFKDINVNEYLRKHIPKIRVKLYINGVETDEHFRVNLGEYYEMESTSWFGFDMPIAKYLNSNGIRNTFSITAEVSHPQFYFKLQSENYTFIAINKKPQQLKAKNISTGEYETIGLSFSNLSDSEKSEIDSIRWPLFNTENSSQQFVIPIGSASYTRRNGSIRAERFGGSAGQYFNLDTNPNLNKDYKSANGTEYKYILDFVPVLRYYESYSYVKTHYYTTTSHSEWASPTKRHPDTSKNYEEGRYTEYRFDDWTPLPDFTITYFTDGRVYAPNASTTLAKRVSLPKYSSLPYTSGTGLSVDERGNVYVLGRDFIVSYREVRYYLNSSTWPDYESFLAGGSAELSGEERWGNKTFSRWHFIEGTVEVSDSTGHVDNMRYRYDNTYKGGVPSNPSDNSATLTYYYIRYRYNPEHIGVVAFDTISFYEKWGAEYITPFLGYYFYLSERYNTKYSIITGKLFGNEYVYKAWWEYENVSSWSIDSDGEPRWYHRYQVKLINDKYEYLTS